MYFFGWIFEAIAALRRARVPAVEVLEEEWEEAEEEEEEELVQRYGSVHLQFEQPDFRERFADLLPRTNCLTIYRRSVDIMRYGLGEDDPPTTISIYWYIEAEQLDREAVAVIIDTIASSTSIQCVNFLGRSSCYPLLLPICQRLHGLKYASIGNVGEPTRTTNIIHPAAARAIADFLTHNPAKLIGLDSMFIRDEESLQIVCYGLRNTSAESLQIGWSINVPDNALFAQAIAQSQVKNLGLVDLFAVQGQEDFVGALAENLPKMTRLECLEVGECRQWGVHLLHLRNDGVHRAEPILRAAARCPYLKRITVGVPMEGLYEALYECLLGATSQLEEVDLKNLKHAIPDDEASRFYSVLQNCYTLKQFRWCTRRTFGRMSGNWKSVLCLGAIICRLNQAGRSYEKEDPDNRQLACKVLAQVADDLDCVYMHLRKHPTLLSSTTDKSFSVPHSTGRSNKKRKRSIELPPPENVQDENCL